MTTTTMTQTDIHYPFGEQGYDIPEYISIYDKPKRPIGRPKNTIQLTDDEKIQRMRKLASKHYYENIEKRRLQQAQNYQRNKNEKALKTQKSQKAQEL